MTDGAPESPPPSLQTTDGVTHTSGYWFFLQLVVAALAVFIATNPGDCISKLVSPRQEWCELQDLCHVPAGCKNAIYLRRSQVVKEPCDWSMLDTLVMMGGNTTLYVGGHRLPRRQVVISQLLLKNVPIENTFIDSGTLERITQFDNNVYNHVRQVSWCDLGFDPQTIAKMENADNPSLPLCSLPIDPSMERLDALGQEHFFPVLESDQPPEFVGTLYVGPSDDNAMACTESD